jgi:hypothetical protein
MYNWQLLPAGLALLLLLFTPACTRHRVEVEPIHITIDVNVRIDRELDNFLEDIFEADENIRQQQETSQ